MLTFDSKGSGIIKIYLLNEYFGYISRIRAGYRFIPEPFVPFTKEELQQILDKIKELETNANPT